MFFTLYIRKRKRSEFEKLKQGDMYVQDLYTKHLVLSHFVPRLVLNEQENALRFEEKHNIELLSNMGATEFTTMNEVYTCACNANRFEEKRKIVGKEESSCTRNYPIA